jgi:hypothetical protein
MSEEEPNPKPMSEEEPNSKRRKMAGDGDWVINGCKVSKAVFDYVIENAGLERGLTGGPTRTSAHFSKSADGTTIATIYVIDAIEIPEKELQMLQMFFRHIGYCLKEGSFVSVERGYAFLDTLVEDEDDPLKIIFKLLNIYNDLQFNESRLSGKSTTKDSLLHFVAKMLCSKAWMRQCITNFQTLSPLEDQALEEISVTISPCVRQANLMGIPMRYRNKPKVTFSLEEKDWKQVKMSMFDYEVIDTYMGRYVRFHPTQPFFLLDPVTRLHQMVHFNLEKKGQLPITISVPTNNDGSFNTSNECMVSYSNGDKSHGSMVLTCLGWLKHGAGQTINAGRTFHIFNESKTEDKDEECKCITPSLTTEGDDGFRFRSYHFRGYPEHYFNRSGYPEYYFKSCEKHASDDDAFFERYLYGFFQQFKAQGTNVDGIRPFPLHDCTPDEMKALRAKAMEYKNGLLLPDRFRLVKITTEALYDEFIEPTADIVRQKDEKFFLNLRELGELLKLVRMKETEEGVEAVME